MTASDDTVKLSLKFVLLTMRELTSPTTIDSYRYPTMNSISLTDELLTTVSTVQKNVVKHKSIIPIIDELIRTLERDYIAKKIMGENMTNSIIKRLNGYHSINKKSLTDDLKILVSTLDYLGGRLSEVYIKQAFDLLKKIIFNGSNEKKNLLNITRNIVSYSVYLGLSDKSILDVSTRLLNKINDSTNLSSIFSQLEKFFNFSEKNYSVIFSIKDNIMEFKEQLDFNSIKLLERLGSDKTVGLANTLTRKFKEQRSETYAIVTPTYKLMDEYSAVKAAKFYFDLYISALDFSLHKGLKDFNEYVVVYEEGKRYKSLKNLSEIIRTKQPNETERLSDNVLDLIGDIYGSSSWSALQVILTAVIQHGSASQIMNEESRLITYWSTLEILLINKVSKNKIDVIKENLLSILSKNYPTKLLKYSFDLLKSNKKFIQIIKTVTIGSNNFEKFSAIVSINEGPYEDLLKQIYKLYSSNPLITYRLYELNNTLSSTVEIKNLLEIHKKRVGWHVQRLYRNRNSVIHSEKRGDAQILPQLNANLHSYVDTVLLELFIRLSSKKYLTSIDATFMEIEFEENEYESLLKKDTTIKESNFQSLVVRSG